MTVTLELNVEDVAKDLLHSSASLVYAQRTGQPLDFRARQIPPFLKHLLEMPLDELEELISNVGNSQG